MSSGTPTGDADEELPDRQCVEVAHTTGERCRNAAIPGADRCHAHVDYAELAADDPHGEDGSDDPAPYREQTEPTPGFSHMKTDESPTEDGRSDEPLKKTARGVGR